VPIHFPEYREESSSFGPAVLHFVRKVNFEIAGIPNPCCLLSIGKVKSEKEKGNKKWLSQPSRLCLPEFVFE
jgi:hypothetical protein